MDTNNYRRIQSQISVVSNRPPRSDKNHIPGNYLRRIIIHDVFVKFTRDLPGIFSLHNSIPNHTHIDYETKNINV